MERRAPLDCHVVFVAEDFGAERRSLRSSSAEHRRSEHRALGRARDISLEGLYVYTKEPAALGTDLVVEVILPYQFDTIVLPGVVRAVRPGLGMDVRFHPLAETERRAVSDYIDTRLRRASGTRPVLADAPATAKKADSK